MTSDQQNRINIESEKKQCVKFSNNEKLALVFGTILFLLSVFGGVTLAYNALTKTLIFSFYIHIWLTIIIPGAGSAFLLLRFWGYSESFNKSVQVAACMYFIISIVNYLAIHLLSHPNFAAQIGFNLSNISDSNKLHMWLSLFLYSFSAFTIIALPDWYKELSIWFEKMIKLLKEWIRSFSRD